MTVGAVREPPLYWFGSSFGVCNYHPLDHCKRSQM